MKIFTFISISKYIKDEKTLLIKKICPNCPVNFNEIFIKNFEKDKKEEISFTIINKILNLFQKLNDKENNKLERNMILAIYYSIISFLNENEVDNFIKILKEAFNMENTYFNIENNKFKNFEFYYSPDTQKDEKPFLKKGDRIYSKGTGLSLLIQNKNNDNSEYFNDNYENDNDDIHNNLNYDNEINGIYFHQSVKDLLDVIHLSLVIHFPLIIEGETGTGKNSAIEYISNELNYKLIKYQITESTTIEDLFGKEIIKPNHKELFILEETEFYKAVLETDEKGYDEKSIILLENIEEASQSILEALIQLFDTNEKTILLPYGKEGIKKTFNLIVTYDPSKHNYSFQNFFPAQILNNSLIFKFNILKEDDYEEIFSGFVKNKESFDNKKVKKIINDFIISKNYMSNIQENKLYSINDLKKYDNLENQISCISKEIDKNDIIKKLIFISSLSSKKQIIELESKLSYINLNYDIRLKFDEEISNFSIFPRLKENDLDGPKYEFSKDDNFDNFKKEIEQDFNDLNDSQKLGMMFLLFGVNSNYTCIIQGPVCSGKTHLIKTFAKLCMKKLKLSIYPVKAIYLCSLGN